MMNFKQPVLKKVALDQKKEENTPAASGSDVDINEKSAEESPFGPVKLKKAKVKQRKIEEMKLEHIDLKKHQFEVVPEIEKVIAIIGLSNAS